MEMTPLEMQKIIDDARLFKTEIAKLCGNVSRQTIDSWLKGKPPKIQYVLDVAHRVLMLIKKGTEMGLFPLPMGTKPSERPQMIQERVKKIRTEGYNNGDGVC